MADKVKQKWLLTDEEINFYKHLYTDQTHEHFVYDFKGVAQAQLAKAEPLIRKEIEAERLDRPDLKEKIRYTLAIKSSQRCETERCSQYDDCDLCLTDQILALIPDEKEIRKDERERIMGKDRPKIICLCGSTRFVDTFNEWRKKLTVEGKIVVSIELVLPQSEREDPQHSNYKVKQMLDELHLRKIDIADEVMILNVGGYIGESTAKEIKYAESLGKSVRFLETLTN